jgi:ketosteroid isomerase-like protein
MSQENVDRFLEGNEAFNRRDIERWLKTYHPDVVLEPQVSALEGEYLGHDGLRRFFADVADTLEMFEADYPDVRDLGDRVLALGTFRTVWKGSGMENDVPLAVVATFRDGLCTHFKDYSESGQALKAVGLSE